MIDDDTPLSTAATLEPDPAAVSEPDPPVVDPEAGAEAAPSGEAVEAEAPAAPADASAEPGWAEFRKALEDGGLSSTPSGETVGTEVKLADALKVFTPKVIAGLPPEIRVGLRTAFAFVDKETAAAAKVRTDGLAEVQKARQALVTEQRKFVATRDAFYKVANKTANLDGLKRQAEGADKADTLTEEGRRKVMAAELHKALYDEFAPLRQEADAADFEAQRAAGADATEQLLNEFPAARDPKVQVDISAQIDAWDKPWLDRVKAAKLDPDSREAYVKFGSPPSTGRLRDAIEIVIGRRAAAARDQARMRETAQRAEAARNISTSTTGGAGGASNVMPETWNGEKLRGNLAAQMAWREANPKWAARVDEARRARMGA